MAYHDIDFMHTAGVSARQSEAGTVPFQALFSAIQQSVIKIAMTDPVASLLGESISSRLPASFRDGSGEPARKL